MEERDALTGAVIAAAIEAHRVMGPGLSESVYQSCLEHELAARGLDCLAQHKLPPVYKGGRIEGRIHH
jgi:GxxExxY protein